MPAQNPRMVGRETELAVLLDAVAEGREGHPRAVLVRGEAGIGKTRLLAELVERAEAGRGGPPLVVAVGQCVDLGPIGAPFTPIRRLLRELWQGVGDGAFRDAAGTSSVIATLATLLPDLADAGEAPAGSNDYVTEAIERVIEKLSESHHLLLIIEDLHWGDTATLALLKTLAMTLRGEHLTMVMTYRGEDLDRGHPLRPVLAELERSRIVSALDVPRLTALDIAAHVQQLTGRLPAGEELKQLASRSDGIPFFVEELVDLGGATLPSTLRDLVLARFERLEPLARSVVQHVAIGGMLVDDELVAATWPGSLEDLDAGLRDALTASVLVRDGAAYRFRHALIQEAVAEDLLPRQRADLHARYAIELQRRADAGERGLAAEIAEHWLATRDNARAFGATLAAFGEAKSDRAYVAMAELGERLLELWPQVEDAEARLGMSPARLSADIAEAVRLSQGISGSELVIRLCRQGLSLVDPDDPPLVRAYLLYLIAIAQYSSGGARTETQQTLHEAQGILEDAGSPEVRGLLAQVLAARGAHTSLSHAERMELFERAYELARGSDDGDVLADVLNRRALMHAELRDMEAALTDFREVVGVAVAPGRRLQGHNNAMDALGHLGRYPEEVAEGEAALAEATEVGLERAWGGAIAANLAEAMLAVGRPADWIVLAGRALVLTQDDAYFASFALRQFAQVEVWDERPNEHAAFRTQNAELFASLLDDEDETIGWALVDTERALTAREELQDEAERRVSSAAAIDAASAFLQERMRRVPGLTARLLPVAARAVAAASADGMEDDRVGQLRAQVLADVAELPPTMASEVRRALVKAEFDPSAGSWREAASVAARGFAPVWQLYYTQYRLAQVLPDEDGGDEAADLLAQIAANAPGHGVTRVARWAGELAAHAGFAIAGAVSTERGMAGLTAREQQVLELVAQGFTNAEIGRALFISPKTASVHVSAILTKIGATNRVEAASLYSSR